MIAVLRPSEINTGLLQPSPSPGSAAFFVRFLLLALLSSETLSCDSSAAASSVSVRRADFAFVFRPTTTRKRKDNYSTAPLRLVATEAVVTSSPFHLMDNL